MKEFGKGACRDPLSSGPAIVPKYASGFEPSSASVGLFSATSLRNFLAETAKGPFNAVWHD